MGARARVRKSRGTAKAAPARTHAQTTPSEVSTALLADDAAPVAAAVHSSRKLPLRSSPLTTAPSLRTRLSALGKKPRTPKARAHAPALKHPPSPASPLLQELEPRLLLSADLNPFARDALLTTPSTLPAEFRALTEGGKPAVVTTAAVAPIQRSNELVFVDTATPEYEALVEAMRTAAQAEGVNVEFVLIDAERDGIRKITDTLGQKHDLDAIHVISHARDGAVQLGSTQLDFQTLLKRASQIKSWGNALTEDGDILFYGCDLAASAEGKSLLEALSRLTGADVAASDDKTGAAAQGGDWQLEFRSGAIDAPVLVSMPEQGEWDHLLATYTVTTTADAGGGSLRAAITSANGTGTADTIVFNIPTSDPGYSAVTGKFTIDLASALPTISGSGER